MLKVSSLNLWRYNEWDKRAPRIISLLREVNADIIFFQEVDLDSVRDTGDQVEVLNRQLGYQYKHFAKAETLTSWKNVMFDHPIDYGLAVLSRIPFQHETISLGKATDNERSRILLCCKFSVGEETIEITNVHFSNRDDWAEAHFKETLKVMGGENSVLIGDFNIKSMAEYKHLYADKYTASSDIYDYVSYPADGLSYDYILIPHSMKFESFECRSENVSDHRMVVADISLN